MGNLLTITTMNTLLLVLLVLLFFASLIGVYVELDNSPKKEDGTLQVTTISGLLAGILLFFSFMPLVIIARSWGVVTLWAWFVTPVFNIAVPSQMQAYGLILFASLFFKFPKVTGSKTRVEYISTYLNPFIFVGMTVLAGWIIRRVAQ